jgi:hypothetical protein
MIDRRLALVVTSVVAVLCATLSCEAQQGNKVFRIGFLLAG